MTIQHIALTSAQVHEPKHVTSATTADAGKVITPSDSAAGTSVLRRLTQSEVDNRISELSVRIDDISTASNVYLVAPFAGEIIRVQVVLFGVIATADSEVTVRVGATDVATVLVLFDGSAAGDVYTTSPTVDNAVTDNQAIRVSTDGASTNAVGATVLLTIVRD